MKGDATVVAGLAAGTVVILMAKPLFVAGLVFLLVKGLGKVLEDPPDVKDE